MIINSVKCAFRKLRDQSGITIAEVMIVSALITISAAAFFQMISYQNRIAKFARAQQGRDVTVSTLRNLLSNPGVLYWAAVAPGNPNSDFANCVLGSATSSCQRGRDYPLTVYLPNTSIVATGSALPSPSPAFYDHMNAEPCNPSNNAGSLASGSIEGCPLAVTTYFRARCPLDEADCKQAQLVQIMVDIKNRAKGVVAGDGAALAGIREVHDEIVVDTAQIALYKSQDGSMVGVNTGCPPGEIALGFDGLGNIFCQRLEYACPVGYYTVGIDRYFRPIFDLGTRMGEFQSPTQVRCAPLDCGSNVMISMFNSNGQLQPECLTTAKTCELQAAKVLTSLESDGSPRCTFLDVCDEQNLTGNDNHPVTGKKNFTRGFQLYNGTFTGTAGSEVGVVKSYCEPYGCGLMQYMTRFESDGQCSSTNTPAATPVPPPVLVSYTQTAVSGGSSYGTATNAIQYPGSGSITVNHNWWTTNATGLNVSFVRERGGCSLYPASDNAVHSLPPPGILGVSGTQQYTSNASDFDGCVFRFTITPYNGAVTGASATFYQCWGATGGCP